MSGPYLRADNLKELLRNWLYLTEGLLNDQYGDVADFERKRRDQDAIPIKRLSGFNRKPNLPAGPLKNWQRFIDASLAADNRDPATESEDEADDSELKQPARDDENEHQASKDFSLRDEGGNDADHEGHAAGPDDVADTKDVSRQSRLPVSVRERGKKLYTQAVSDDTKGIEAAEVDVNKKAKLLVDCLVEVGQYLQFKKSQPKVANLEMDGDLTKFWKTLAHDPLAIAIFVAWRHKGDYDKKAYQEWNQDTKDAFELAIQHYEMARVKAWQNNWHFELTPGSENMLDFHLVPELDQAAVEALATYCTPAQIRIRYVSMALGILFSIACGLSVGIPLLTLFPNLPQLNGILTVVAFIATSSFNFAITNVPIRNCLSDIVARGGSFFEGFKLKDANGKRLPFTWGRTLLVGFFFLLALSVGVSSTTLLWHYLRTNLFVNVIDQARLLDWHSLLNWTWTWADMAGNGAMIFSISLCVGMVVAMTALMWKAFFEPLESKKTPWESFKGHFAPYFAKKTSTLTWGPWIKEYATRILLVLLTTTMVAFLGYGLFIGGVTTAAAFIKDIGYPGLSYSMVLVASTLGQLPFTLKNAAIFAEKLAVGLISALWAIPPRLVPTVAYLATLALVSLAGASLSPVLMIIGGVADMMLTLWVWDKYPSSNPNGFKYQGVGESLYNFIISGGKVLVVLINSTVNGFQYIPVLRAFLPNGGTLLDIAPPNLETVVVSTGVSATLISASASCSLDAPKPAYRVKGVEDARQIELRKELVGMARGEKPAYSEVFQSKAVSVIQRTWRGRNKPLANGVSHENGIGHGLPNGRAEANSGTGAGMAAGRA